MTRGSVVQRNTEQKEWEELFLELTKLGWVCDGDCLKAPAGTIWFFSTSPWGGGLRDLAERMEGRLQRIEANPAFYDDPASYEESRSDTQGLVSTLRAMLARGTPPSRQST